jgi:anti-sigma factor RsiW
MSPELTTGRTSPHDAALYFYGELPPDGRTAFERHLPDCKACQEALDELAEIRKALAPIPALAQRSHFEWAAFMRRLDARIQGTGAPEEGDGQPQRTTRRPTMAAVLAIAASLVIGIGAGVLWQRERSRPSIPGSTATGLPAAAGQSAAQQARWKARDAAIQHLDRSKIVLLGLANKDAGAVSADDWAYERSLAASLLPDTRLLRLGALEAGDAELASLLNDLEVLMLQASFSAEPDRATLSRLQRYISHRDLLVRAELGI